jgi:hypothetical protein
MDYLQFIDDPVFAKYFATDVVERQALITTIAEQAACEIDLMRFPNSCDFRARAIRLLAAHRLTLYDRLSASSDPTNASSAVQVSTGQVSSVSVSAGSNSVSFQLPEPTKFKEFGTLSDTFWGLQLLELYKNLRFKMSGFLT